MKSVIDIENMILKLPAGKYTVRETEMLMGVVQVPSEYFQNKSIMVPATVIGEITVSTVS